MTSFHTKLGTFFLFFLLLGVVVEGVGQTITRECLASVQCSPQGANLTATDFRLEDQFGNIIDVNNCNNISGPIFISFEHRSVNLSNVFFQSQLIIINNADNSQIDNINFDYLLPNPLPNTQGGTSRSRFSVNLPSNYNCQAHRLELSNIKLLWTPNQNRNQCGDYNNGGCREISGTRDISVGGFFYDLNYNLGCFQENGSVIVDFFVNIAGGTRPYNIEWTIGVNGETGSPTPGTTIFPVNLNSPEDVVTGFVTVTHSGTTPATNPPGALTPIIPSIFQIAGINSTDNDLNISSDPNGTITVDLGDLNPSDFDFFWFDELNGEQIFPPDPNNPTFINGRQEGLYNLIITDRNTGLCRVFDILIDVIQLPVIYADLTLTFNPEQRAINFRWSTTKEWEASHFEIERADRGNKFHKIGEVDARGWSDELTHYNFEDKNLPLTGGNLLYRLKQVDFNGRSEYSEVLSVRQVPKMEFTQGVWRAFPNPTDGSAFNIGLLDRSQYEDEPLTFRLVHPLLQTASISVNTEMEMNQQLAQHISRMPNGVFVVEIQWGRKIEHIKVMKK